MDQRGTEPFPSGKWLLHDPALNKGTAFTEAERDALGLRGLLPPHVFTQREQIARVLENLRRKDSDIEKYIFLISLQDRNETLFYRVLQERIDEMIPLVYTPTVGQACLEFGHIFRRPRGLYVAATDRGRVAQLLRNWPNPDVRCIVVTDGERILGLGDLGAAGMGIPVGKLALYTACAGVHPSYCMPVMLDVGTDNAAMLADTLYLGIRQQRLRGTAYDDFVDEFVNAVQEVYPHALIQFEDFANVNAFRLLERYRNKVCTFNDDIQGTASVALAGLYSALRLTGGKLEDQTILFIGAGEAGTGIANLIVTALMDSGLAREAARLRCWFVDSQGLVVRSRENLATHKLPYAHEHPFVVDPLSAVESLKPTALIGVSGHAKSFTRPMLEAMARLNSRPIVFALSNPTSKSECTADEAYTWTEGRAVFASGSPFDPVTIGEKTYVPGQGNNVYIFPGMGLAISACEITRVTDEMFCVAARVLAEAVSPHELEQGSVYPPLRNIREVSAVIAVAVAEVAYRNGLARRPQPENLSAFLRSEMYEPDYRDYVEASRTASAQGG